MRSYNGKRRQGPDAGMRSLTYRGAHFRPCRPMRIYPHPSNCQLSEVRRAQILCVSDITPSCPFEDTATGSPGDKPAPLIGVQSFPLLLNLGATALFAGVVLFGPGCESPRPGDRDWLGLLLGLLELGDREGALL